jgi:hypothetical protein
MAYDAITPAYYEMLQPSSPWHAGAPGWATAPFPGWGENPNLVGPRRLATHGVGGCGCSGAVGADGEPSSPESYVPVVVIGSFLLMAGALFWSRRSA